MSTLQCQYGFSTINEWILSSKPLSLEMSEETLSLIHAEIGQRVIREPHSCPGGLLLGKCDRSTAWRISVENYIALEWDQSRGGAPFLTEAQSRTFREKLSSWQPDAMVVGFYRGSRAMEFEGSTNFNSEMPYGRAVIEADRGLLANCCPLYAVSIGLRLDATSRRQPHVFALWEDANVYDLAPKNAPALPDPLNTALDLADASARERTDRPASQVALRPETQAYRRSAVVPDIRSPNAGTTFFRIAAWALATMLLSLATYIAAHLYVKPLLLNLAAQARADAPSDATNSALSSLALLRLKVSENGTALELSWDPLSPAARYAKSARLVITDGALVRQLELDPDQVRSGRIVYTPVIGDVTFRLEITDSTSRSIAESIRVLGGSLSRASTPQALPDLWDSAVNASVKNRGSTLPRISNAIPAKETPKTNRAFLPSESQVTKRTAPPTGTPTLTLAATENGVGTQAPNTQSNSVTVSSAASPLPLEPVEMKPPQPGPPSSIFLDRPFEELPVVPVQPPLLSHMALPKLVPPQLVAPPSISNPNTNSSAISAPAQTVSYIPPRPIKKVTPNVGAYRAALGYRPAEIEVHVKVDELGRVTDASTSQDGPKANSFLANAAVTAAKAWFFEPATLRGKAIPADYSIVFQFHATKN